jgi:hypothetical protein
MARRITHEDLQAAVTRLNNLAGAPLEPYTRSPETGELTGNAGHYHLSGAYGGWSLVCMHKSTGVSDVLYTGHISRRALYDMIDAYIRGYRAALDAAARTPKDAQ